MNGLSIGIFDSGLGGLTVLKELKRLLPNESFVYLGDTARVPYGNRSPQVIKKYAFENSVFLLAQGIKLLVIACNTSSAVSLDFLRKRLPINVIGVIEPACRKAIDYTKKGRIGVIGTKATIKSRIYEKTLKKLKGDLEVFSKACPLFVPIVEEGLTEEFVAYHMAEFYLREFKEFDIDVLILGCTHYPMLEPVIKKTLGENIFIVNSGAATAEDVKRRLEAEDLIKKNGKGGVKFYVTDDPENFKNLGSIFLKESIRKVRLVKSLIPL